jgi:hypothetical protein
MLEGVLMTRSSWTGLVLVLVLVATAYACGSDDKGTRLPDAPVIDPRANDAALSDGSGSGSDPGSGSGSGSDASVDPGPGPGSDASVCCDPGPGPGLDAGLPHLDAAVLDARAVPGSH